MALLDSLKKVVAILYTATDVPVQVDDTNKLGVSLYGKSTAAGDTPVKLDSNGRMTLAMLTSLGNDDVSTSAGGLAIEASSTARPLAIVNYLSNGSTYDRERNNCKATLLGSAARTEAATAAITNYNHRGILIVVDVTARAGATTLTPKLTLKGPVTGTYDLDFWTATAPIDTADGTFAYLFYPAETPAAITFTEEINVTIPRDVQLTVTPNDANSVTYSVGIYYLL